jgi:hypothetical protein
MKTCPSDLKEINMSKFKFNKSSIEERNKTGKEDRIEKKARLLGLIEKGMGMADRVADKAAAREEKRLRAECELLGADSVLEERKHYREEGSRLSARFGELVEAAINSNAASLLLQVGMERFVAKQRREEEIEALHHQAIVETLRLDVEEVKGGRLKVWPWEVTRNEAVAEEATEAVAEEAVEAVAEEEIRAENLRVQALKREVEALKSCLKIAKVEGRPLT